MVAVSIAEGPLGSQYPTYRERRESGPRRSPYGIADEPVQRQQFEIDIYRRIDLDGLAIQQRCPVTPFADRIYGCTREFRVGIAVHHIQGQRSAFHPDDRVQNYRTLDTSVIRPCWIDGLHLIQKFCRLYVSTEADSGRLSRFDRSLRDDVHFFIDWADLQRDVLRGFSAGLEDNL